KTQTDIVLSDGIKSQLTDIVIPEDSPIIGRQIVQLKFPKNATISFIQRDNSYMSATGSTVLLSNDKLFILAEDENSMADVYNCLCINKK
ncbi:MAG: TrkA C-terminal domain-containing protein, partial [Bacteroidota bacterium]|nr:TrkA C-terminal domain-containing protein [Bacteroidota bacterium]